ncbi:hypothetical protein D920_01513 [Enterococcus faecalis 13-SD-W-01]|nr:hypothetical protein D920_01513 [Enterococcus faecalis 13-SD-W-01]
MGVKIPSQKKPLCFRAANNKEKKPPKTSVSVLGAFKIDH